MGLAEHLTEEATQAGYFILIQGDSRRGNDSFGWQKQGPTEVSSENEET